MPVAIILDLLVVALLVPTIVFAVLLNNRLGTLRRNRDDLARLVTAFNDATNRAEGGIPRLRKVSEEAGHALQEKIERTQLLRDDLAFMVERASAMADRLESAIREGRGHVAHMENGVFADVSSGLLKEDILGRPPLAEMDIESAAAAAERAATKMVQAVGAIPPKAEGTGAEETRPSFGGQVPSGMRSGVSSRVIRNAQPLGMALSSGGGGGGSVAPIETVTPQNGRSEAEKELLRALRAVR